MCGIFGSIGKNANPGIIRALALINRERGKQSLGFFSANGKMVKSANDPLKALGFKDFDNYITRACSGDNWFLAGHTRYATHGAKTNRNAHPFRFGRIIGSHNGVVNYPHNRNYQVDSEYLFDSLNRHNGNYQAALADIEGYWGLTWYDGQHFYISAHDNRVYVGRAADGVWYYSSDKEHLLACIGKCDKVECIDNGRTIRFDGTTGEFTEMPTFRSVAKKLERRWWTGGADVPLNSWPPIVPAVQTRMIVPATGEVRAVQSMPPAPYVLPTSMRTNKAGRIEGYGCASQPEYADPFDAEDYYSPTDSMDTDDLMIANEMAGELGYADFDDYLFVNGYNHPGDLELGLEWLDFDWCEKFDRNSESAEDAEIVVDADIPF